MRQRGLETGKLSGITDEYASFTYTPDLAKATLELLEKSYPFGVYHITNSGFGSWYDLAKEIFTILGKPIDLTPVLATEFKRAAKRPDYSVLENNKLPKMRPWQEALKEYLIGN